MPMKKTEYDKDLIEEIVKESVSIAEVLKKLDLKKSGGSYKKIKKIISDYEISTEHFLGQSWLRGRESNTRHTKKSFIEEVLCENGMGWTTNNIKKRLLEINLKENVCEECGQIPYWHNEELVLQLHHIDGNNKNNEISNLKMLCPNCHSQTKNFSGKKEKKRIK